MRIIAEIGVNHDGQISKAESLVEAAAEAGATHVKFQYFSAIELTSQKAGLVEYQESFGHSVKSQLELLRPLEITKSQLGDLYQCAKSLNLTPFSTVFSPEMLEDVSDLGQEMYKVPSGEITNFELMRGISELASEVLLSTGMSYLSEVSRSVEFFEQRDISRDKITVMQCTTSYPAAAKDLNLSTLESLSKGLRTQVGFSDHSVSNTGAVLAVALGAKTFEKHLTLNKFSSGPDHAASLEPDEFRVYVETIGEAITAMGKSMKLPGEVEVQARDLVRRRVVARLDIHEGEKLTSENTAVMRHSSGFGVELFSFVLGAVAPRSFSAGEAIEW